MKDLVYQQEVETQDALLYHILDAATCVKDSPNELV
jgi:hypothetical protein